MTRIRKIARFLPISMALLVVLTIAASASALQDLSPVLFLSGDEANGLAAFDQFDPAIAQGGNGYLVVWTDARTDGGRQSGSYYSGNGSEIYAARLGSNGSLLDTTPIIVNQSPADQIRPNVAWNGQNWLVVWLSQEPTQSYFGNRVMAARVSPGGAVLDAPIAISPFGVDVVEFAVSSDGNQWAVVWEGGSGGTADLRGTRLSSQGAVLDPGGRAILPEEYYLRSDLDMAFAGDEYLLTWQGINVVQGKRLRPDLTAIDSNMITISSGDYSLADSWVTSNGTDFFVVWEAWQSTTYFDGILGARINHAGQVLDPNGITIWSSYGGYISREPRVAWDGSNWFVSFMLNGITVLRVNPQGVVIDPNNIPADFNNASNKWSPDSTPAFGGGIQLAWFDTRSGGFFPKDIYTARVAANRAFGAEAGISNGLPSQIAPNVAANGSGYLLAFRDDVTGNRFVKAQRVDGNGSPVWAEPVVVAASPSVQEIDVAWNGSLYLLVWNDSAANKIFGRRVRDDGSFVDPAPFLIMGGAEPEVSAIGDLFLVVGTHATGNPQFRNTFAARVQGSTGAVLDSPKQLSGIFAVNPDLAAFRDRWIATWEQHPSHDNPATQIVANFINTDGTTGSEFVVRSDYYSVRFHYNPTVATDGTTALIAWEDPRAGNSNWNLFGRRLQSNGTLLDSNTGLALVTAPKNQRRASAAWDGTYFVLVYEDERNNTLFYDPSTDVFATRVDVNGAVIDPGGFAVFEGLMPSVFPDTAGNNGQALLSASVYRNNAPYLAYRVGMRVLNSGPGWPTATPPTPQPATPTNPPPATSTAPSKSTPVYTPTRTPSPSPTASIPTATLTFTPSPTASIPTATLPFTPSPTAPPSGGSLHSGDLDGSSAAVGSRQWRATVRITVHDASGNPVSGVSVSAQWSGSYSGPASCTTDSAGTCSVITGNIQIKAQSSVTLRVNNLAKQGYSYNAAANTDPDGDSNGTQITVNKP
jgi:hypothetical protein